MAGSYYPLGSYDAHQLALMIGQLSDSRTRVMRADMALYCWSRMMRKGKPCPHFTVGIRTISQECDVTEMQARRFLERAEETGWMLRVGTIKRRWPGGGGEFVKRTFVWVAEEAAEQSDTTLDNWLIGVGACSEGNTPHPQKVTDPNTKAQIKVTRGSVKNPPRDNTHQSTEYSECSALHSSLSVEEFEHLYGAADDDLYDSFDLTPAWMSGGEDG